VSELLHSTPLTAAEYVLGKFGGVMATLTVALLAHVLLALYFFQLAPVAGAAEIRGPFRLTAFVLPALVFALPLVWACAGLSFAVGERTRRPLVVMVVPVAIFAVCMFFLWQWTPAWLDPRVDRLLMLFDPSGLRWLNQVLFAVDRGVAFYNTQPLELDGIFLVNRLLTAGIPALAVVASIGHCRRVNAGRHLSARRPMRSAVPVSPTVTAPTARKLAPLQMTARPPGFHVSALQVLRGELAELRAHPALYIFTPLVMMMVWEYAASTTGSLDAPIIMSAGRIAVGALERISIPVCLLLLFYLVESLSRDRATRVDSILYATPVRTAALLLARNAAAAVAVAVVLSGCCLAGLAYLALQGTGRVEVWPFLLVWGLVLPPTFFVWSGFVTAVYAIVRNRYTAYAVGIVTLILSGWHHTRDSMTWVHNWDLWNTLRWTDMGVLDLDRRALLLNRVEMLGAGLFLLVLATRCFARPERDPAGIMPRLAPSRMLRGVVGMAPFALVPLVVGGVLAVDIREGFQGAATRARPQLLAKQRLDLA
jgi:hypothetical protein